MIVLDEPWTEAAQRRVHRALLAGFAHPGAVIDLGSAAGAGGAALAVLATLVDAATALCDLHGLLEAGERSLLAAPPAAADAAPFVLADGARPPAPGLGLNAGSQLRPEAGATLVLACAGFGAGGLDLDLAGPGIETGVRLAVDGLDAAWLALRDAHVDLPCGIDLVLADRRRIACLPRTTRIERSR